MNKLTSKEKKVQTCIVILLIIICAAGNKIAELF
jgi:hypothetical protein